MTLNDQSMILKPSKMVNRPRFEGCNICSWIGFKHVMYLVEEAVLDNFRSNGYIPRSLFEDNGLCLEIVDSHARILHALHVDDLVNIEVIPEIASDVANEIAFKVNMYVDRENTPQLKAVVGKVSVQLKVDDSPVTNSIQTKQIPELAPYTVEKIQRRPTPDYQHNGKELVFCQSLEPNADVVKKLKENNEHAFVWKWHVPYFYCHFTERMQHSGYLRLMEEVEDLFLKDSGISIRTMLHDKKLIPVVPTAQVELLEECFMEETIYTVYSLVDFYRSFTYTHRMDCFVVRGDKIIHTATGTITHGYAEIENRKDWRLVVFDDETTASIQKNLI